MRDPKQPEDDDEGVSDEALDLRAHERRRQLALKRGKIRLIQVAVYVAVAAALPFAWSRFITGGKTTDLLAYLLSAYLALRALAMFIKYRQEIAPARYTRDYIEANDLFPPPPAKKNDHDIQ